MLTGDDKGSSYMEDNKDKKPVNKGNPVREWISDNLRYIILIVAIILFALIPTQTDTAKSYADTLTKALSKIREF